MDIYEVIAADIKKPIYAETWMNGETTNQMPSYCDGSYTVEDVTVVQSSTSETTWKETQVGRETTHLMSTLCVCVGGGCAKQRVMKVPTKPIPLSPINCRAIAL